MAPTAVIRDDTRGNGTVSFQGVTVTGAADLTHEPRVTSTATTAPTELQYKDLVICEGQTTTPTSTVTVQYSGLLYLTGKAFDSTWSHGRPAQLPLTQVIPGFTQGIAGAGRVRPMKIGGRRIIIIPASLGYGTQPQTSIPANSPLVFVVDLTNVHTQLTPNWPSTPQRLARPLCGRDTARP